MKTLRFLLVTLAALLIACPFIFTSCSKETVQVNDQDKNVLLGPKSQNSSLTISDEFELLPNVVFPAGTIFNKIEGDPHAFEYILPSGYIMYDKTSSARSIPSIQLPLPLPPPDTDRRGTITCTCTEGTGCSPFIAEFSGKREVGCNMSSKCNSCTKTVSGSRSTALIEPEILNVSTSIEFINSKEELSKTSSPSLAFFELPQVQKALKEFAKGFQKSNLQAVYNAESVEDLPASYVMVAVNVFGKAVMVPVDSELAPFSTLLNPFAYDPHQNSKAARTTDISFPSKPICSCSAGSGCLYKSASVPFMGKVQFCDAGNCSRCSMTF